MTKNPWLLCLLPSTDATMDSAGDVPQLDEAPVEPARRSSRPAAWSSYVSVDRDELASDAVTLLLPGEACGAATGESAEKQCGRRGRHNMLMLDLTIRAALPHEVDPAKRLPA